MKESYFKDEGIWLKGNLHSHSTVSDGCYDPMTLAKLYADHGYDFLSMTDHNLYVHHDDLSDTGLILMTGVEHDLEYRDDKCTHVVGIGKPGKKINDYDCRQYVKEELTDQQMIDMMTADGQFTSLAHPVWSHMTAEEVLSLQNFHALEIYNNGAEHLCHGGNAEVYWDLLLQQGRKVFATATDDVHEPCDLFGGWIWVKAAERSKEAIYDALFKGAYYASSGPKIFDFGIEGDEVYINCSESRAIHFVSFYNRGESFFAAQGETINEARHKLYGDEIYCRALCVDKEGYSAWTQPIFFNR